MFRKILLYGLPIYLYGLELLLKQMANVTADSVAGPTLAGAGIGFLLPLTNLKGVNIDSRLASELSSLKAQAYSTRDKSFTDFVWTVFFVSLVGWMYSIYLTLQLNNQRVALLASPPADSSNLVHASQFINLPLLIGAITFVIAVVLSEVKERI